MARRWILLGGPGGRMTIVPVGSSLRDDRYGAWQELIRCNFPRRFGTYGRMLSGDKYALMGWALRTFEVVA